MRNRLLTILLLIAAFFCVATGYMQTASASSAYSSDNLWPIISSQFSIPGNTENREVEAQVAWFLKNPEYIHYLTENARPYLYYIFHETEKLHLPAVLALLPMIESNYTPTDASCVGAEGLWQLMPRTAGRFGVKMNAMYDGRRSLIASTKAALYFLSYLYQEFNHDWLLALAAYNAGPGTVWNAIHYNEAHHLSTDFWALPLPKQTRVYVPKLLALATIIRNPHAFHVDLAPVPNRPTTNAVDISKQLRITTIARLASTTVMTIKRLNPALLSYVTPPHQLVALLLPERDIATFIEHLRLKETIERAVEQKSLIHYAIQPGNTLIGLAYRFKTTVPIIQKLNHLRGDLIHTKEVLLLPNLVPDLHESIILNHEITGAGHIYTVVRGDSFWTIAHRFHTTPAKLEAWNHIPKWAPLQIGESLVIEEKTPHRIYMKIPSVYKVKAGNTLSGIAYQFHITVSHIMKLNHLATTRLHLGQRLRLSQ